MIRHRIGNFVRHMMVAVATIMLFNAPGARAQGQGGNAPNILGLNPADCELGEVVIGDGAGASVCFPLFSQCPCDIRQLLITAFTPESTADLVCVSTHDVLDGSHYEIFENASSFDFGFRVEHDSPLGEWSCRVSNINGAHSASIGSQGELKNCLTDGQAVAAALNFECEPPEFEPHP